GNDWRNHRVDRVPRPDAGDEKFAVRREHDRPIDVRGERCAIKRCRAAGLLPSSQARVQGRSDGGAEVRMTVKTVKNVEALNRFNDSTIQRFTIQRIMNDLKYAFRQLLKNPGFTA